MLRDTDTTDTPTLERKLKLKISPINVGGLPTLSGKLVAKTQSVGKVSVKCRE